MADDMPDLTSGSSKDGDSGEEEEEEVEDDEEEEEEEEDESDSDVPDLVSSGGRPVAEKAGSDDDMPDLASEDEESDGEDGSDDEAPSKFGAGIPKGGSNVCQSSTPCFFPPRSGYPPPHPLSNGPSFLPSRVHAQAS